MNKDLTVPDWLNEENAPSDQDQVWLRNARYSLGIFRNESERLTVMRKRSLMRIYRPLFLTLLCVGPLGTSMLVRFSEPYELGFLAINTLLWISGLMALLIWLDTQTFPFSQPVTNELLQRACYEITRANLLAKAAPDLTETYLKIASEDPALALAGLRMQIEKRIRALAYERNIQAENLVDILCELRAQRVFNNEQYRALSGLRRIMNWAVHGDPVDQRAANFIRDIGPRLVARLDELLAKAA